MRTLDLGFKAHIENGATTLATCWKLTRADGTVLGFTDHDSDLSFMGAVCRARSGLTQGAASGELGMDNPDDQAVSGLISDAALTAAEHLVE